MFLKVGKIALFCAAAVPLHSCATAPKPVALASGMQRVDGAMPLPTAGDFTRDVTGNYVGPRDKLVVTVFGVPELNREVIVDGAGSFSFPLVGEVAAAGRTPPEIERAIETGLANRYVKNPQVTVNVTESVTQTLTVDGQVTRPGMYPVNGRMTLQRAVAVAGGTAEFADLDDVIIQRDVGDTTYVGIYNLGAIRRGNYPDPDVYPSDIVVVGDSKQRRLFKDLLQVVPLLTTPLIIALQNN